MGHVYLYPIQSLVPQRLALSLNLFERGGTDFGFCIGARLFLRNERNANPDGHLRWTPGKREESPRFNYATDEVNGEIEPRFPETSHDEAVSMRPFGSPP
jgi:hypothetical protein